MTTPAHVQDLLSRLDCVRARGDGWEARCPAHDDKHASLSVGKPLIHHGSIWHAPKRCCKRLGLAMKRFDGNGREDDHIDVHSLRRTFATDALANGADIKSVQEIGGWKTVGVLMSAYAKMRRSTKRQVVARLSYGMGSQTPEHVVELPSSPCFAGAVW